MSDLRSERYRVSKSIVNVALDLPVEQRASYVDQQCGDDEELRREAHWLLQSLEAEDNAFLGHDPLQMIEPDPDDIVPAQTPHDYKIVRRLDEGGHGVVFLAERSAGDVRQQVALKLLNFAGQLSPNRQARFRAEAQILAKLGHPNIAHLIDVGTFATGRPFIAMEFVDGVPITRYCEAHALKVRERIELFMRVCDAVAYAHQHLIIHRDLKPANILVTEAGEPKLLDFGIARLLGDQTDIAMPVTEEGQHMLTPTYASPEQIRGDPLTTVSDVYSLGVLLYELLAGVPPFVPEGDDSFGLSRRVCEIEPLRPSRRTTTTSRGGPTSDRASSLSPISPDLDAITLKALRKRPEDRYDSVTAFVSDLQRYLARRPVVARKGHLSYRARRYVERNRWPVAAASTFALLVIAFAVNREFELQRTQLERDKAQQIADFMVTLFEQADPSQTRGESVTVREMLDRGAMQLESRTQLDPRLKASMLEGIGRAYSGLALPKQAMPALTSALALYPATSATSHERAGLMIKMGEVASQDGEYHDAIGHYQNALRTLGRDDGDLSAQARIGVLHNQILLAEGSMTAVIAELKEEIELLERQGTSNDLLPSAYKALGQAYQSQGDARAAASVLGQAIDEASRSDGPDAPYVIDLRSLHGKALVAVDPARAVEVLRTVVEDHARVIGRDTMGYALRLNDLAVAMDEAGQVAGSLDMFEKARQTARRAGGAEDRYYLQLTDNLAMKLVENGRQPEAEAMLQDTIPILAKHQATGIERLVYAHALYVLGAAQERRHDADAERTYMDAEKALGPNGPDGYLNVYEAILYRLTDTRVRLKRYEQARSSLEKLKLIERQLPQSKRKSRLLTIDLLLAEARYVQAADQAAKAFSAERDASGRCSEEGERMREQYAQAMGAGAKSGAAALPACAGRS
jgi:serine/threonine-protein kinase